MPTTINGIGTIYYGKKNLTARSGICAVCNCRTQLKSYETRLWFVILFIPVIPLGKKQVLDECSACRMHRVLPLEQWRELKERSIREALDSAKQKPDDPSACIKAHSTLAGVGELSSAEQLAKIMQEKFANSAAVQLYLGSCRIEEGDLEKADACFARALELEPANPDARRVCGIRCMERGELEKARELLSFLEEPGQQEQAVVLTWLGQAYQEKSRNQEALDLYKIALRNNPELARDKKLQKSIKACEKALRRR